MRYKETIKELAKELNLPYKVVDKVYRSYWFAIKSIILNMLFSHGLTEQQFNSIKSSIALPSLGKLAATYDKYLGLEEEFRRALECLKLRK